MSSSKAAPPAERWCPNCSRMVAADEDAGRCPRCGESLDPPAGEEDPEGPPKPPWHFKVLVVATIGYLIYRAVWFIEWLSHHH